MRRLAFLISATLALGACDRLALPDSLRPGGGGAQAAPATGGTAQSTLVAPPASVSAKPAALDTVSEAEKNAARAAAAAAPAGGELGQVTVSLGDPAEPGLWVKSALVTSERTGTVRTGSGESIAVMLKPLESEASGAQISLPALRALGLPLTGLHPVTLASAG